MLQVREQELMDDPTLDPGVHALALASLARLNTASGAVRGIWRAIHELALNRGKKKLRVLDVACGGGDVLWQLKRRADTVGLQLDLVGSDISDTAVGIARRPRSSGVFGAESSNEVRFLKLNALEDTIPSDFDVIMTSLFTHHLDASQVVLLLKKMYGSATELVLVNDLERTRLNWAMVWLATRLLSSSPVVHFDGPVSVRAAYTRAEFLELAREAGITHCKIKPHFPCRFLFAARK